MAYKINSGIIRNNFLHDLLNSYISLDLIKNKYDVNFNNTLVNLHNHSMVSDGDFTHSEIVNFHANLAKRLKLEKIIMSVTDHDSFNSKFYFNSNGSYKYINLIPGVEVSTTVDGGNLDGLGNHFLVYSSGDLSFKPIRDILNYNLNLRKKYEFKLKNFSFDKGLNINESELDLFLGVDNSYLSKRKFGLYLIDKFPEKINFGNIKEFIPKDDSKYISPNILLDALSNNSDYVINWAHPVKSMSKVKNNSSLSDIRDFQLNLYYLGLDGIEYNPRKSDSVILKNSSLSNIYHQNNGAGATTSFGWDIHSKKDRFTYTDYMLNNLYLKH